jgi:hypothetical protein
MGRPFSELPELREPLIDFGDSGDVDQLAEAGLVLIEQQIYQGMAK